MTSVKATICQVLHSLAVGGAEVLAARLARRLEGEFRFVFVCLDVLGELGESLRAEGFTVEVLGRRPGIDLGCSWRLARFLRRQQVDLIHAHQYTPFFYSITARLNYRRAPVLFTEHGRWYPDYPRWKRIALNRLLLERRDRVVAVGEAVRQALIKNEGFSPGRVQVIYNGVELGRFSASTAKRDALRAEWGASSSDFVVLQVARLDYLKDHATALRTMKRIVELIPSARLVLVGEGPERGTIEAFIRELKLDKKVLLLGTRRDIPDLLAAADVFLLTSISEGIPLTIIEAMAARLPVVSTNVGGVQEIVLHGQTGLLSPAGNDELIAEHLHTLANDRPFRGKMGEAGFWRAHALFSENLMLEKYRELYTNAIVPRHAS